MKDQSKKITASLAASRILPRPPDANKGSFGHVLVLAGSPGFAGAAALCSLGALRAGAGLVTVGMPESQCTAVTSRLRPEAMTLALPGGADGTLCEASFTKISDFIERRTVTSIVAGPGLGNTDDVFALVRELLSRCERPLVLDADALNALSRECRGGKEIPSLTSPRGRVIVTPHPGEFSRLTGKTVRDIQANREKAATEFTAAHDVVCVLKGAGSIVAREKTAFINTAGGPWMASGGTGDVLAGMIGALAAQVREPRELNAALCGVYLHGLAAGLAAREKGEVGLLAGDIAETVPAAIRRVMKGK